MRWRRFAFISLAANVLLAVAWLLTPRPPEAGILPASSTRNPQNGNRTNIIVRRMFFSWSELESSDYPTYISNLRDIGCPEQTIRDIIIADVNALFARRRSSELVTSQQQWWRSQPDLALDRVAAAKLQALDIERRAMLTRLMGTNWDAGVMAGLPRPALQGVMLDGPLLGTLPDETKQAIQDISARSQERLQGYINEQTKNGKPLDPVDLAKLRNQTRDELARVLSPTQLEEFLLRYSQNAAGLRSELGQLEYFNASPDEFRTMFRATDNIDQQIAALSGSDSATVQQRQSLEDQRESAIKAALGPKRYAEYKALQDPLYRESVSEAQEAGTPEAAGTIYAVNLAAAAEQDRINSDTNLTATQKGIELKKLELDALSANTLATGGDLPPEDQPRPQAPPRRTYVVQPGDTVALLSLFYGIPASDIRRMNPNVNLSNLKPGQTLFIPPAIQPPAPSP